MATICQALLSLLLLCCCLSATSIRLPADAAAIKILSAQNEPPGGTLHLAGSSTSALSSFPGVWPLPRAFSNGTSTSTIDASRLTLLVSTPSTAPAASSSAAKAALDLAFQRFQRSAFPHVRGSQEPLPHGSIAVVNVTVSDPDADLQLGVSEAYTLTIPDTTEWYTSGDREVTLEAGTVFGAMRGLETLSQLVRFDFERDQYVVERAPWRVADAPRFPHRELLLDSARHFQPLATIFRVLDSLSYAKMNTLHWHLSDSQSFPFVAPSHPEMAGAGAFSRGERYTRGDVAAVVAHARSLGIRVVVEIDTPGHAGSWCHSHPEVCPSAACSEPLLVSSNATFQLIGDLLGDVAALAPDRLLHLGGDEVRYQCWNASQEMAAWMRHQGMAKGDFDAAYAYSVHRTAGLAAALGRDAIVWGEVWTHLGSSLPKSTVLDFWLGGGVSARGMKNATSQGYRALWNVDRGSNVGSWYLDSLQTTWDTMYAREPCTGLDAAECHLVLGGGGEMWGETADPSDELQTVWPRLAAIAERLWSPREATSVGGAVARALPRLQDFRCLLEERGIAASPVQSKLARSAPAGPGSCRTQ